MPTTTRTGGDAAAGEMLGDRMTGPAEAPPPAVTAPVGQIDAYMREFVEGAGLPENLRDAVCYSLLGPGKRLRPLLVWHAATAAGGTGDGALPAAAALELVHAFSLVHDDLPGIDNDDLRRGRPTLHRRTSEAMAILAGDAMLTLAFQVLVERVNGPSLAAALARELTVATTAMIAGQVYDTLGGFPAGAGGRRLDEEARLRLVHENKTGALIRAACRMGAMCGLGERSGIPPDDDHPLLRSLTRFGEAIGLMFQVVDDLLDVTQTTDHLGKRSGKDQEAGKLTYPGVLGLERSREEVRRLHEAGLASLAQAGSAAEPLRQVCTYLAVRSR
jgi:geranylgeranyl diphosphate synthase type II